MSQSEGSRKRKRRINGRTGDEIVIRFPKRGVVTVPDGMDVQFVPRKRKQKIDIQHREK